MVSHHPVMSIFHESNSYKKFLFRCSKCWFCCVNIIRRKEKQKDMLGVLTNFVENESRVYFWSCVYLLWQIFNCLPNIWNWDILSSLSHTRMLYAQILLLKFQTYSLFSWLLRGWRLHVIRLRPMLFQSRTSIIFTSKKWEKLIKWT